MADTHRSLWALWIFLASLFTRGNLQTPTLHLCTSTSQTLHKLAYIGESREQLSLECACRLRRTDAVDFGLLFSLQYFSCTNKCDWKLNFYHDGCLRHTICCIPPGDRLGDGSYNLHEHDFPLSSEMHVALEKKDSSVTDTAQVRLAVLPYKNKGSLADAVIVSKCGFEPGGANWKQPGSACATLPPTVPSSTATTATTTEATTATTETTVTTVTTTASTAAAATTISSTTGAVESSREEVEKASTNKLEGRHLIAVICGSVGGFVVVMVIVIIIAVSLSRREKRRKMRYHDDESNQSPYSYTRTLPNTPSSKKKKKPKKEKLAKTHSNNLQPMPPPPMGIIDKKGSELSSERVWNWKNGHSEGTPSVGLSDRTGQRRLPRHDGEAINMAFYSNFISDQASLEHMSDPPSLYDNHI